MTELQKHIIELLLKGYNIAGNERYGYRLRSPEHLVVLKIKTPTFLRLKPYLRNSKGLYYINKNEVRKLHGNDFRKKTYRKNLKQEHHD